MIQSLLIANRGEIACRIIRTARALGMRTIAVYSEADRQALFVRMADQAVCIGPAPAAQSYLCGDKIIAAALASGAQAIHPGYGFLSENADFADAVTEAGLIFVGPPAAAIRAMGLKDAAKALVEKAGVPVVPGYHGARQEADFLESEAERIGYPVLIKAVAGGGGKGMRKVERREDFSAALASAQREGQASFGDPRVLIERYITAPRHIEMQIFADQHGHVLHLFERDCSLQRRHQKVIEEAPAPGMIDDVREAMGRAAVEAARAVGYVGAGTIEFIVDGAKGLRRDGFYFMEMNTRLQVEHPVTEAITGLDLVALQLRIAAGEALPMTQQDVMICGHAVEARLYAEDPERSFLPSTGTLHALSWPQGEGLRIDTGVEEGDAVSPFYDPMIAKLIAYGPTRAIALERLACALDNTRVAGPRSNARFLSALCRFPEFVREAFDTGTIERNLEALGAVVQPMDRSAVAEGLQALLHDHTRTGRDNTRWADDPWSSRQGFQLSGARRLARLVRVDQDIISVTLIWDDEGFHVEDEQGRIPRVQPSSLTIRGEGGLAYCVHRGRQTVVALVDPAQGREDGGTSDGRLRAPMHGKLIALAVGKGAQVVKGQRVAVIEAMKMEHALLAPYDGVVDGVFADLGQQVGEGVLLMQIVEAED